MVRTRFAVALLALCLSCKPSGKSDGSGERATAEEAEATKSSRSSAPVARPYATAVRREFEVRMGPKKMGDLTIEWSPLPSGGFRLVSHTAIAFKAADNKGETMRSEKDDTTEYGADLGFLSAKSVERENKIEERTETALTAGMLHATVDKPSHHDDKTVPLPADASNDMAVFQVLRAEVLGGAALPREKRYTDFDTDDMAFTPHTFKLVARQRFDTPSGAIEAWKIEQRDEKDGEVTRGFADDAGLPLQAEFGAVTLALRGSAPSTGEDDMAEIDSRVPVDGAFEPGVQSLLVDVTVKGDTPDPPGVFVDSTYQTVRRDGDVYSLTLKSRGVPKTLLAPQLPLTGLAPEVSRFLTPTSDSQSTDPAIVARSKDIVGAEHDSLRAARAIAQWVYRNLEKRDGTRGAASAVETLTDGAGDCTEHTALTVALARAAGIPARNAGGIVLIAGKKAEAGYHAWPELWVGEWVVLDPALGNFDVGASYLWLGYDEPGEARHGGKLARLVGRTKIAIKP